MEIKFHRRVQIDVNEITDRYAAIQPQLADDFFTELSLAIKQVAAHPTAHHFDHSNLRRCNLTRFPYHMLFDQNGQTVRVWVVRHNRRSVKFGTKRFN